MRSSKLINIDNVNDLSTANKMFGDKTLIEYVII